MVQCRLEDQEFGCRKEAGEVRSCIGCSKVNFSTGIYCLTGGPRMKQGIFFEAGEGLEVSARGSLMVFKAIADTTDGAFSLMERTLPVSNRRPQPHTHQGPEGFYVLEGSI